MFAQLRPEAFRTCFLAWLTAGQEQSGGPLASQLVAIDGKTAQQSFDRAIDRQIALNLLKRAKTNRHGMKVKRHRAGWDNDYLQTVLGI